MEPVHPSNITVCNSSPSLSSHIFPYREMIFPILSGVFSSGFELDLPLPVLLPTYNLCMAGSSLCLQRALLAPFIKCNFVYFSSQDIFIILSGYFTYRLCKEHLPNFLPVDHLLFSICKRKPACLRIPGLKKVSSREMALKKY